MTPNTPKEPTVLSWKTVVRRAFAVAVTGLVLYLVFPKIIQVFVSWPRLSSLKPPWFFAAVASEVLAFVCTFALKRLALRTHAWFSVVTAALSGNAVTNIFPGGDAAGAAVEFRMLAAAGIEADTAVGGLTAFSLLQIGTLFALPIFSLPAILAGTPVSRGLVHTAYLGIGVFVLLAIFGTIVMTTDRPLRRIGIIAEKLWNGADRITGHRHQVHGLPERLLSERSSIRTVLGQKWREAILLCVGRLGFDFFALLATLSATGSRPSPSLVLLAYSAASIVGLLPLTPGGLGIVEASLSSLLVLAGIGTSRAYLATLAYRLLEYWLPILAGMVAYLAFRRRYHLRSLPSEPTGPAVPAEQEPTSKSRGGDHAGDLPATRPGALKSEGAKKQTGGRN